MRYGVRDEGSGFGEPARFDTTGGKEYGWAKYPKPVPEKPEPEPKKPEPEKPEH